ncbi:MAG: hypothetical protein HQL97_10905 [Magnetococcales bacterium]|nr:hypothetical protein [Magnetococcales bacterium]
MNYKGSTLLAMAGALALVVGTGACGGGGGSGSSTTSIALAGLASDGLLQGATVSVYSRDGTTACTTATTDTNGKYSVTVPATCATPLRIEVSGGTDKTTNKANDLTLKSLVTSSSQTTANLSPQTTLMTEAIKAAAGGTLAALATKSTTEVTQLTGTAVTNVVKAFGFGSDALVANPMSTPITTTAQTSAFSQAGDAAGEVFRRLASSAGLATPNAVSSLMQTFAASLSGTNSNVTVGTSIITPSTLQAMVSSQRALVTAEVLAGSLVRNVTSSTATTGTLGTGANLVTTGTEGLIGSITGSATAKNQLASDVSTAIAAGVITTGSVLATQLNTVSTSTTAVTAAPVTTAVPTASVDLTTVNNNSTAAVNATSFIVHPSVTLTDYPLGTVASASNQTIAQSVSSTGVMTAVVGTALSASNLTAVGNGSGKAPVINFSLGQSLGNNKGSGSATVTALLKDGNSDTRTTGQRQIMASTSYNWSSDGTTLTLTAPANGVASVSYYTAAATAESTTTITNVDADLLTVTSGAQVPATLNLKVANLFGSKMPTAASMTPSGSAGSYFYKVTISGIPLAACASTDTTCSTTVAKPFTVVQGTISAQ